MEILTERLDEKAEVFGYYAEGYRFTRKTSEALIRSEVAMTTAYEIFKAMGLDNAHIIKEAGINRGKEIYISQQLRVANN